MVHGVASRCQHCPDTGRRHPAGLRARPLQLPRAPSVDGCCDGAVRVADRRDRRGVPCLVAVVVAWHGFRDDRGSHLLQHCGCRAARGLDDRRDSARPGRRGANSGGVAVPRRPAHSATDSEAGTVVVCRGDLPVQLHLLRCRQVARGPHTPDAGSRDRSPCHTTRRRWRRGRTVGNATLPAGRRDRVGLAAAATDVARTRGRIRAAHCAQFSRAFTCGLCRPRHLRHRRGSDHRPRDPVVPRRRRLVADSVEQARRRRDAPWRRPGCRPSRVDRCLTAIRGGRSADRNRDRVSGSDVDRFLAALGPAAGCRTDAAAGYLRRHHRPRHADHLRHRAVRLASEVVARSARPRVGRGAVRRTGDALGAAIDSTRSARCRRERWARRPSEHGGKWMPAPFADRCWRAPASRPRSPSESSVPPRS